jgi:hypothetical protein
MNIFYNKFIYYIKIKIKWRMNGVSSSAGHDRLPARPISTHTTSKSINLKFDKPNPVTKSTLLMTTFIC